MTLAQFALLYSVTVVLGAVWFYFLRPWREGLRREAQWRLVRASAETHRLHRTRVRRYAKWTL